MDTRTLLTFVTVSDTLNYQKAADQLQYAPSTVFKHIQQLEMEMGASLIVRGSRSLKLTETGRQFLPRAKKILAEYREALNLKEATVQMLTVGGCEINIGSSLIDLFLRFADTYPSIRINMITSPNAAVPNLVRGGQVDLGFYYSAERRHTDLENLRLYKEPVYLITSRANPLSGVRALHYEDLNGTDFVYSHDSCCFVTMLMHELEARNVVFRRVAFWAECRWFWNRHGAAMGLPLPPAAL